MSRPFLLGLTGSIGMGKSTTAKMFADAGLAVWDADAAVHRLYAQGGAAVEPMSKLHPDAIIDGAVSRDRLKNWIAADPTALMQIEALVHPMVGEDRRAFIAASDEDIIVLDVPLLFEGGGEAHVDATVVVSTSPELQRERVLARGTMSEAQFEAILAKQMPDAEKRARADFIVDSTDLESARHDVQHVVDTIRKRLRDA